MDDSHVSAIFYEYSGIKVEEMTNHYAYCLTYSIAMK